MKFFIDANLSPSLVSVCHAAGYDATCARDRGLLNELDPPLAALCLREERICVTVNFGDFRELAQHQGLHPGLITMPSVRGDRQRELMEVALRAITELSAAAGEEPNAWMINRALEVEEDGRFEAYELPASE